MNYSEYIERAKRLYFEEIFERCEGNIQEIVKLSGLSRQNLYSYLSRHELTHLLKDRQEQRVKKYTKTTSV
jgi:DNA-binding NtrC family response regulator